MIISGMSRKVMMPITLLIAALCVQAGCSGLSEKALEEIKRVPKEFFLGPEDVVEVIVWRNEDLSRSVLVRPDGMISMPIIGDVYANGLTTDQLAQRIAERLKEYKQDPTVSVSLKEVNSYAVFIVGEVAKPGKYQLKSLTTVLQAISMSGGFTKFASPNSIQVIRNSSNGDGRLSEIRIPVRYDDLVAGKGEPGNFILRSGDTLVVP